MVRAKAGDPRRPRVLSDVARSWIYFLDEWPLLFS
jgi:hypothetical protein